MPGEQPTFEPMNLGSERIELFGQSQQGGSRQLWKLSRLRLPDVLDQIAGPPRALRRDDPELGAMAADGVDQHSPLAHQQFAGPV